ncbi:hypothetical protein ACH4TV_08025 [Streptomyces sp. NPDC020898]|uniref:hypothetical protein n=1 Tax=Streptomyces sp. NPDC020898 TaxID=3365101 RepID=UPI0037AC26AF
MREDTTEARTSGTQLTRRAVLATGVGLAGALWITGTAAGTAQAATDSDTWDGSTSQNGWNVAASAGSGIKTLRIEGSDVSVALREGAAATLLLHVARRFHYEIHPLSSGDVTGHSTHRKIGPAFESNYLSGTALAIRPLLYPAGVKGGFFPDELIVLRDILADCEGAVRWGGDERGVVKESHFQIDVKPGNALLTKVAAKIDTWAVTPGAGAGAIDPFVSARRKAARTLEHRQAA